MPYIPISKLKKLTQTEEIKKEWNSYSDKRVIRHPDHGFISPNEFRKMCIGEECKYCGVVMTAGKDGTGATIDHVLNKARHPEYLFDYSNLEVICRSCNSSKNDRGDFQIIHKVNERKNEAQSSLSRFPEI